MKKLLSSAVILILCINLTAQSQTQTPEVSFSSGIVKGTIEDNIAVFRGIPYAAPPVGEFRWRPPQPVLSWKGVRDATIPCAECAQAGWSKGSGLSENSSEDCLFLNIWKPASTTSNSKLPVMVWIHGGGFVTGSSNEFTGISFAKENVILVSINYRLGRLGFFAFPALSKENPKEYKGNYAYMDQVAALQWVQKNIAQFGGDPKNVTIFGESAGGVSVHSLLTIPSAKGLFQKAIIESGGGRDGVLTARPLNKDNSDRHYPVSAETIGFNFAKRYKIEGTDQTALDKLRNLSTEKVIDGGDESSEGISTYSGPILDGKLVTETAESSYSKGNQSMVPIIIGSNNAEVPSGFVNAQSKDELFSLFGLYKDDAKSAYDRDGSTDFNKILSLVNTDKVWAEPARFTSRIFTSKKQPAFLYLFSYVPKALENRMPFGASHASEIPFVFNNLIEHNGFKVSAKDKDVARLMNSYWINFAKNGNPNSKNLPEWPVYDEKKNEVFEFKKDGSAENNSDYRKERLDVIEKSAQTF